MQNMQEKDSASRVPVGDRAHSCILLDRENSLNYTVAVYMNKQTRYRSSGLER
jgi:hypothetical protein